jgi:mutator protein MutT
MKIIEVAAGLVFHRGLLLLAQRQPHDHMGGRWEFPGGKREAGETLPECLKRELQEELGIQVEVGPEFDRVDYTYPDRRVLLVFFPCQIVSGNPSPIGCQDIRWVKRSELGDYEFPPADASLIDKLRQSEALWR